MAWKRIKNFEKYYEISDSGEVRRIGKNNLRKPQKTSKGYEKVFLYSPNYAKAFYIHRLVAEAFITKRKGKTHINHLDCDKSNNRATNLEWCSIAENNQHAMKNGLYKPNFGERHGLSVLTKEKVLFARKQRNEGRTYVSIAKELKVDPATIRRAVTGESWKHIGNLIEQV